MSRTTLPCWTLVVGVLLAGALVANGQEGAPTLAPPGITQAGAIQMGTVVDEALPQPTIGEYHHSDCLSGVKDWYSPCPGDDIIVLTVEGQTLHVLHQNAAYNCCVKDIVITAELVGNTLLLTEEEIDPMCFCICCYETGATIVDLAPGTYTVQFCWEDRGLPGLRCDEQQIVIPPRPYIRSYSDSGCKEVPPSDAGPCPEDDLVTFRPGPGKLNVLHENATYNCCPADIMITANVSGNSIAFTEIEVLPTPCDCDCCYDVKAELVNLVPGTYAVTFEWFDYGTWQFRVYADTVVIPPPAVQSCIVNISK